MKNTLSAKFWRVCDRLRRLMGLFFILLPLMILSRVLHGVNGSGLWLVAERDGQAQDNGAVFANYVSRTKAEIKLVMAVDLRLSYGPDWPLQKWVNTIPYGSLKHKWYYAISTVAVSTHVFGASPYMGATRFLKPFRKGRVDVMISHGVKKDHHSHYAKKRTRLDLLTCCTTDEFNYYDANCHYDSGELVLTGLCRFDEINKKEQPPIRSLSKNKGSPEFEQSILFMPTFRKALASPKGALEYFILNDPLLNEIKALLTSPELANLLQESGTRFIYRPHPRLEKFSDAFKKFGSANIQISSPEDCSIRMLINRCSALITDYSSVAFDFAYQGKPVVYLQSDIESYRTTHYKEGYFDYSSDGFGPIFNSIGEVVEYLKILIEGDMVREPFYEKRAERTFKFQDQTNCGRVLDAIISHPILSKH